MKAFPISLILAGALVFSPVLVQSPAAASAPAATKPAAPARPDPIASAPPEIREFLLKAEAADKIEDKLARCLAFPDLPGHQWPKGLAAAHCESSFGPHIALAQAKAMLERGELAQLDALFAADLERHYSKTGFSEVIHADFDDFDSGYEADRFTKAWLEKAPESPFALAARATHYREMAAKTRGKDVARETPLEAMQGMREYARQSAELYRRALKAEPRLITAYFGLITLGMFTSDDELRVWAAREGKKLDPYCKSLARAEMYALMPRWGGSYQEMLGLREELEPALAERPLLALTTPWPFVDRADYLYSDGKYDEVIAALEPIVKQTTLPEAYTYLASSMMARKDKAANRETRWWVLLYYLEPARFCCGSTSDNLNRGIMLLRTARRPAWALQYAQRVLSADPKSAKGHQLMADILVESKRYAESEVHYLAAMADKDQRKNALYYLVLSMMQAQLLDKARAYSDQYRKEFPDDAWGWWLRARVLGARGYKTQEEAQDIIEALETFMTKAASISDRNIQAARNEAGDELERLTETLQELDP